MFLSKDKIMEDLADMLISWRHSGFDVSWGPRIQPGGQAAMASGPQRLRLEEVPGSGVMSILYSPNRRPFHEYLAPSPPFPSMTRIDKFYLTTWPAG